MGLIVERVIGVGRYDEKEFESIDCDVENRDDVLRGIVRKENAFWLLLKVEAVNNVEMV